jgi:hypothetical protein
MMVDDRNPFDLEALQVDPERMRQPARPKKWRRQFVRVPWQWVECLRKAKRISTYRLALVLLYEHWRSGGRPIALSNVSMQQEGLARRSKWNALAELRTLDLITVKTRSGKSPRIVLRHLSVEPT